MDGDGFTYACMYACIYVSMYVIIIMAAMARWFSTTKHDLLTLYPCIGHNVGSLIVTMLVEMANPLLEKLCLKHYEFDLLTRFPSRSDNFFLIRFPCPANQLRAASPVSRHQLGHHPWLTSVAALHSASRNNAFFLAKSMGMCARTKVQTLLEANFMVGTISDPHQVSTWLRHARDGQTHAFAHKCKYKYI